MTHKKKPLVNCHTHIFTGDHVPPYLAKSFVGWPVYKILSLHTILKLYKQIDHWRSRLIYDNDSWLNRYKNSVHEIRKHAIGRLSIKVLKTWFTLNALHILLHGWIGLSISSIDWPKWLKWLENGLNSMFDIAYRFMLIIESWSSLWLEVLIMLIVMVFFPSGRNLILFVLKNTVALFKHLPGKNAAELAQRYILIGKFTLRKTQASIYEKLKMQYPENTRFVVLPMDMKYMDARELVKHGGYYAQLQHLAKIKAKELQNSKDTIRPFVFVDPRRIADKGLADFIFSNEKKQSIITYKGICERQKEEKEALKLMIDKKEEAGLRTKREKAKRNKLIEKLRKNEMTLDDLMGMKPLFDYEIVENQKTNLSEVVLKDGTLIKEYIEDHKFSGFKIYPALGYYPFDENLLALWKYAADNQIPIMTHCISGTIFYRGVKKKEWFEHPVFMEPDGNKGSRPLKLSETANIDFSVNFGHPMNYLCLLEEQLLRRLLARYNNPRLNELFGFTNLETKLKQDLSNLKICLAHFGGEPQWDKYLESDRNDYAQQLIEKRSRGLKFVDEELSTSIWNRLHHYWRYMDWYSIICSLMIQYPNVYADISYILSKPRILPLLKETLDAKLNPCLRKKVLYGTDFFVVRNHFSEKDLLAQMRAGLSRNEFDLIARRNPESFLR